jgi:hypothetical protein
VELEDEMFATQMPAFTAEPAPLCPGGQSTSVVVFSPDNYTDQQSLKLSCVPEPYPFLNEIDISHFKHGELHLEDCNEIIGSAAKPIEPVPMMAMQDNIFNKR